MTLVLQLESRCSSLHEGRHGRDLLTPSDTCQVLSLSTRERQLSCTQQRTKLSATKCLFKSAFVLWIATSPQTAESLHMTAPSCLLLFAKVTTLPFWVPFVLLLAPTENRYSSLWSASDFRARLGIAWGAFQAAADEG